ncbi:regulatory protein RecX [Roseospira visakhapatnamensis]|uniref:Regulatory protein n=1 Tax=Roseospira visakhapatnamensis TaxID=390880 RepID=A0A7W6RFR4_9PROT|nr:RecX family transcriptional regulator [Roseospira visakhapatnamensis]MBB4267088.1 regulatory protein [Roseospira visakhapatnamensis]
MAPRGGEHGQGRARERGADRTTGPARRGAPRRLTPRSLENAAVFYLQRYSASAEGVRRVLRRRVHRAARAGQALDPDETTAWIEAVIARLRRAGLLDDARHAETRAAALTRRGESRAMVARRLRADGVDAETIRATLDALAEDAPGPDPDLAAAVTLARRRRLGPYRTDPDERALRRDRDLAALARKGFSARVAHAVVDAPDGPALEDRLRAEDATARSMA